MSLATPTGTRDVLPQEMGELRAIAAAAGEVFEKAGYGEVQTPALEYEQVIETGSPVDRPAYRVLDEQGRALVLRSDMTVPIARLTSARYAQSDTPHRFWYQAPVYRGVRPGAGEWRELLQIGVELIGAPAPQGTSEVLAVLCDALDAVGLKQYRIALGDAGLFPHLLEALNIAPEGRERLTYELYTRDLVGYEREVRALELPDPAKELLLSLPGLRGGAEALAGAEDEAGDAAAKLRAVAESLPPRVGERLIFDLGLARSLGYYTGAQPYQVLWNGGIHPGTTVGTVLRWTAPAAGVALVSGSVNLASAVGSNGVAFTIKHDAATIDGPVSLTTTTPHTISESVTILAAGEVIDFIVAPISGNSYCNTTLTPAINFTTDGSTPANPTVSALSPSSLGVSVGAVQSLTVTLSSAPASVASVSVSSSDPTKATVPATVSVAAGQLSANIPVTGVAAGSSTITATYNNSNKTAAVTVSNPASGSWSNAPVGGTVLKDTPLNDIVGFIDDYPVPGNHIETISDAIFSPTKGLVHRLDPFARTGGGQVRFVAPTLYRELYAGMYWRSNPQFQGRIVVNKMFFLRSSSIQSNGFIGWMARNPSGNASGPLVFAVNGGASNQHILGPTSDSGSFFFPNVGNGNVSAGVWYKLEWRLRASTTMTSQDGAYQLWINGVLVSSYLNINYSNGTGLDEWVMNQTWDGSGDMGSSNTVTWEHYLDHLMLVGKN